MRGNVNFANEDSITVRIARASKRINERSAIEG
jgi:hypothetical protein